MVSKNFEQLLDVVYSVEEETELIDYHAFIFWFLKTTYGMNNNQAFDAICDGTHDKGVDAVVLDHIEKHVTIIQSKFSANMGTISKTDTERLADVREYFRSRKSFDNSVSGANQSAARLLEETYQAIRKKSYTFELVLLSTHSSDSDLEDFVYDECGFKRWQFTFFDYRKVLNLHKDSLRDYTPKTGHYNLRFKDSDKTILRKDKVNSWVLNVSVEEIRQLATRFPKDLFRKNIRNFLGTSKANRSIKNTLKDDPENFWYYNNGITILCDQANLILEESHIRLVNPQVVNGCQTVTSIKNYKGELNGDVLVRVIQSDDHTFIQNITLAQNTSNPVKARDFKSNDPIQIRLKRELKKKGFYYEIKRGEEFSSMRKKYRSISAEIHNSINNEKVAKFLATERISPSTALGKGSEIFFDTFYEKLFTSSTSSSDIITAWSLDTIIRWSYKGESKPFFEYDRPHIFKNRAKYYVLNLVYHALSKSGIRQWKKKWSISWSEPEDAKWYSFLKKFDRIAERSFKLIYRSWRKSKIPNLNNYLQGTGTLEDLKEFNNKQWYKLREQTQYLFVDFLSGM